jgi:mevalonate kinase
MRRMQCASENIMKFKSPGKIILSGEHAVVYGNPALGMAVNYFAETCLTKEEIKISADTKKFVIELPNFAYVEKFSFTDIQSTKVKIDFTKTLSHPVELIHYMLIYLAEIFSLDLSKYSLKITITTDIPIGSGMGSSAAVIVSFLQAFLDLFALKINSREIFVRAKNIEDIVHKKSSGLDVYLALHGGAVFYAKQVFQQRNVPQIPFFLVNTGKPASFTAECVDFVAKFFKTPDLLREFAAVAYLLDDMLQKNEYSGVKEAVRENHVLLTKIGVVPLKVQKFIQEIENVGGVAKISGAGAVYGDNAGMVLVFMASDKIDLLQKIVAEYNYALLL